MRVTTDGYRISFESDESVLKSDSGDGCMILTHYKMVNFMFYELYFNNNPPKKNPGKRKSLYYMLLFVEKRRDKYICRLLQKEIQEG